jgi:hypothetical protein
MFRFIICVIWFVILVDKQASVTIPSRSDHGPGQSPRCAVRDEEGKRPMTAWPYGLWRMVLRPEGSGGRVSSWVGAGEAECEGRRRGASCRDR